MTRTQFLTWYYQLPILTYCETSDEYFLDSFNQILQWKSDSVYISDEIPDQTFTTTEYWLLLGLLEDCIEYGSSPRGAWLTPFGEDLLHLLQTTSTLTLINWIEEGIPCT